MPSVVDWCHSCSFYISPNTLNSVSLDEFHRDGVLKRTLAYVFPLVCCYYCGLSSLGSFVFFPLTIKI